ncbi:MAG: hypothetical protein JSU08_14215 [Acidobacteria bacterium]|nr:hypothetical protein [Acidobacteriota bacterium]
MFIGHFAVGFAAKRVVPRVSLAVLFVAVLFADILWPVLVLLGTEQVRIEPGNTAYTPLAFVSYPWSHSLVMLVAWGVAMGGAYRGIFGGRRSFVVLAALVVSHWVLDWITHAPDMPVYPGGPTYGLSLWNSVSGTMAVELALYATGVWIYTASTRATDRIGQWAFLSLATLLVLIYLADSLMGTPPPSVTAICIVALSGAVLFPAWAWLADRHREVRR